MKPITSLVAALCAAAALSGCATDPSGQNDPYEKTNRSIFAFDQAIDHAVARPVAVFYNHAIPQFARDGIHNVLSNLGEPVTFGNDVLQGSPDRAGARRNLPKTGPRRAEFRTSSSRADARSCGC